MTSLSIHFSQAHNDHTAIAKELRSLLETHAHVPNGHFVLGRVYSADGGIVVEEQLEGSSEEPPALLRVHESIIGEDNRHDLLFSGGSVYVSIVTRIPGVANGHDGLFQGVYRVDRETLFRLASRALLAALICVTIVAAHTSLLYPTLAALNRRLVDLSGDLLDANVSMIETLGTAIALRDGETGAHNHRVTLYAVGLGEAVGLPRHEMRALIKGAFLHDVGKIGVSDTILLKPLALTSAEFAKIKSHVIQGLDVVRQSKWLADAGAVVGGHHEKWDGSGYPLGLRGTNIPLLARIFSIVDVFDALTSRRPYKPVLSFDEAWDILERSRGIHFDPELLDRFHGVSQNIYEHIASSPQSNLKSLLEKAVQKYFL